MNMNDAWGLDLCSTLQVSKRLRTELHQRANDFSIMLDDVAITHLSFGAEFAKAIETKQVAYQEAERAKFMVQKADQERKAAIVRAEGESEAARMISEATTSAGASRRALVSLPFCVCVCIHVRLSVHAGAHLRRLFWLAFQVMA